MLRITDESGESQPYRPGTLFMSLHAACNHLSNNDDTAWQLMRTVEEKLIELLDDSFLLSSDQLADVTLTTLKNFDTTSYVKYASMQPELVSARKLAATLK